MATRECPTIEKTGELITQRYQAGTANFISSKIVVVTFVLPFTNVPKISAMPDSDPGARFWVSAKSVIGFTLELSAVKTITFDWLAIQSI